MSFPLLAATAVLSLLPRPSLALLPSFDSTYARTHWIPCLGFYRDCYPTFEFCYDRRYCMLNTWILLSLGLFAVLSFLGILLIFYFVLFRRGKWMICGLITLSLAAFLLTLAVLITVALHDSQELDTPDSLTKHDDSRSASDDVDEYHRDDEDGDDQRQQ